MLAVLFGGACAGLARRLSAARLYAVLHSRHDRGPRLDRAGAGRVRVLAAGPAASLGAYLFGAVTILQLHAQGCGLRHSLAIHVVAALSRDHHRAGADLARAHAAGSTAPASLGHRVRAGPLKSLRERARRGAALEDMAIPRQNSEMALMRRFFVAAGAAAAARRRQRRAPPPPTSSKSASSIVGPIGDFGWTYQHDVGRQALVEGVRRQDRDHLSRERQRRSGLPSARSSSSRAPATS